MVGSFPSRNNPLLLCLGLSALVPPLLYGAFKKSLLDTIEEGPKPNYSVALMYAIGALMCACAPLFFLRSEPGWTSMRVTMYYVLVIPASFGVWALLYFGLRTPAPLPVY